MARNLVIALIILLAILHQDYWWWDDSGTLAFGFIPIGLAYHAGVSIAAAVLWALAVRYCWPAGVDVGDEEPAPSRSRLGHRVGDEDLTADNLPKDVRQGRRTLQKERA